MPAARVSRLVSLLGAASLAEAQMLLDLGVAAAIAAGVYPEALEYVVTSAGATGGAVNALALQSAMSGSSAWSGVSAVDCVLLAINNRADLAAVRAAIDAEVDAQATAAVTPSLRDVKLVRIALGDAQTDAVALLFTNGAPSAGAGSAGAVGEVQTADGAGGFAAASDVVAGAGFITIGAPGLHALSGLVRARGATAQTLLAVRDTLDTDDLEALSVDAGGNLYVGTGTSFAAARQFSQINIYALAAVGLGLGGTTYAYLYSGNNETWRPHVGSVTAASPWGAVDGRGTVVPANAPKVLTAAEFSRRVVVFSGAMTATRAMTFPLPTSEDEAYERVIDASAASGAFFIRCSVGVGGVVDVAATKKAILQFTSAGVSRITADA